MLQMVSVHVQLKPNRRASDCMDTGLSHRLPAPPRPQPAAGRVLEEEMSKLSSKDTTTGLLKPSKLTYYNYLPAKTKTQNYKQNRFLVKQLETNILL